jgi:hypothetical protein
VRPQPATCGCVLLAMLLAALLTNDAHAYSYPGERPAPALVQRLAVKADKFWHARGVDSCASAATVLKASSLLDDDDGDGDVEEPGTGDGPVGDPGEDGTSRDVDAGGRGTPDGCGLWVASWLVKDVLDPYLYGTALELCTIVYHEAGHTGGLDHARRGLMAAWAYSDPYECRVWARRFDDRKYRAQMAACRRAAQRERRAGGRFNLVC